jgi:pimeloyl-ACP methyl ester carboxylesterase
MKAVLLACTALAAAPVLSWAQPALTDRTFEVSGLSLHLRCGGERQSGAPLVVLEAGGGNSADTWRDVHASIAQFARACAYDRPGRGSSTNPPLALTADAYVPLLSDLLKAAGEPGPYVMVGHSIGGVIAALFANRHQDSVAGMVLVDSSHEEQIRRFSAVSAARPPGSPTAPPAGTAPPSGMPSPEPLPVVGLIERLSSQPWHGSIPLVVLTRGKRPPATGDPNVEARHAIWLELQRDWAARSPKGRQIVAANSGHYIHNDEPALVIDAVRAVVGDASKR